MHFRYDINGLRAIAVIAVVLFHFNPAWVPGGFAGVDVFFVISGFLMTGIIFRGLESDDFNLFKFYVARANRIIPALAVLCLVLLVFGWFYLVPPDYQALGKHVASSMGFLSNVVYLRESGYFDAASHEKWLLHTWSLSVEWQFYILYPIALVAFKKFLSLENLKRLIVIGTVLGFVLSVVVTMKLPNSAYYLLPTRAWEMTMGAVAFLYPWRLSERQKKLSELIGLALIIVSYAFVSSDVPWPGHFSLFPVLGAYLIIVSNQQSSLVTNNKAFQYLGKWSYSIYLWHWPIVVVGFYFYSEHFEFVGIFLSIVLGFLSFHFVERVKFPSFEKWLDAIKVKPLYLALIASGLGYFVLTSNPNQYLFPMKVSVLESIERKPYACFDKNMMHESEDVVCKLTEGDRSILAIGDSHSYSSLPAVETLAKNNNLSLYYTGFSGCPPILGVSPIRGDQHLKDCKILNDRAVKFAVDRQVTKVFLAARWTYYTEGTYSKNGVQYLSIASDKKSREVSKRALITGLDATFKAYFDHNIDVILMLQVPMQHSDPDEIFYRSLLNGKVIISKLGKNSISLEEHVRFQKETNHLIETVANKYPNVTIYDPTSDMCLDDHCLVGNEDVSYYFDDDHLSILGASKLVEPLSKILVN
ncbi:acyltransferase family protein [Vibrio ziniensis]|uniref:Acyltransferase n=1 Tax=Vibrio ziniensis TaxID=2711221 RepID=A0A6G7CLR9_9VIBR|nr:acyltransferase family protein [Vibrio ziniensis]QIH43024.1 acyltransferase [Vibrio ziniensis]